MFGIGSPIAGAKTLKRFRQTDRRRQRRCFLRVIRGGYSIDSPNYLRAASHVNKKPTPRQRNGLSRGAVAQPLSRHGRVSLVLEPGEGQRDIPRQRIATLQLAIRLNQVPRGRAARHSLLGDLMEKNLIEVFGQRDSARREARSPGSTLRTARSLKRRSGSLAATLLTRRSSAFSRKPRDACFARQRLRS